MVLAGRATAVKGSPMLRFVQTGLRGGSGVGGSSDGLHHDEDDGGSGGFGDAVSLHPLDIVWVCGERRKVRHVEGGDDGHSLPVVTLDRALDGAHMDGASDQQGAWVQVCLLYTSPSPRDATLSRMPSSA